MTAQRTRNTRETIVPKHGDRKWKPLFIAAAFVAVIAIGASACSTASADNPATAKDQTTTTIGLLPPGESTISNALIESGEFPTLVALLDEVDLLAALNGDEGVNVGVYSSSDEFTLFAPTEEAFAAYLAESGLTIEKLAQGPDDLEQLMLQHLAPGGLPIGMIGDFVAEVPDDAMFESAYGQTPLTFTSAGGDVLMVDGATIIGDETAVVNGFIHTIDAVLVLTPGQ